MRDEEYMKRQCNDECWFRFFVVLFEIGDCRDCGRIGSTRQLTGITVINQWHMAALQHKFQTRALHPYLILH